MSAVIKVETCPQCGAPVRSVSSSCEYCGAEFLVTSLGYLKKYDRSSINKYVGLYKRLLSESPDDGELNCAMGICYLDLGLYDLSIKYTGKAIEQMPDEALGYYYHALALLKGRRPKILGLTEIRKIEDFLSAAIQLDDTKSKYYYLWALIKYDFYMSNGLAVKPPTFEDLILQAEQAVYEEDEIEKMLERVPVDDEDIVSIIRRRG